MSYDYDDDRTLRERIEANPRPALVWLAGVAVLLALELGRVARAIVYIGSLARGFLGGAAGVPGTVADNVAGSLGGAAGTVGAAITALLLLAVAAVLIKWLFVPVSLVNRLGLDTGEGRDEIIERGLITVALAVVAALVVFTPVGAALEAAIGWLTDALESAGTIQTLTQRDTIPNQGYRTPGGGWEGTFLGLSPAVAWAIRVFVIYAYSFVVAAWLWKGYEVFREHYREADWTPRDDSINRFRTHYWGIFGLAMVFAFVVMAIFAPSLGPVTAEANLYSPYEYEFQYLEGGELQTVTQGDANLASRSQGGSDNVGPLSYDQYDRWHPAGTNQDGKDLFTFLMYGARTSLVIGLTSIGLATAIASALSMITAYYKGLVDVLTVVASDTIISIPAFLLILLLNVLFAEADHPIMDIYNGGFLLALILAGVYWPGLWRSIRGPSLQVASEEWVDAAKSYGQSPGMTMRKHMSPYILTYIMIYASLMLGAVIIVTAALSFLGLGISPPTPEWGRAVSEGRQYISGSSWHISTIPGIMIVFVVTGFNALGDGIRDAIDPESEAGDASADAAATGGGA
ncbi:ABC transporter permease [Saliphagus sp. LR7]|uniref:ABC transporter permease n=1 Tax=Saliphagus sp. LR7 TaxID=2282654 RepID=UPI000DF80BF3|nr:ABC transporter permease [Saliphagus sp. LR7]